MSHGAEFGGILWGGVGIILVLFILLVIVLN
ncbi:sporulation protein YjcZ [Paenibacillus thermoaerophilus]|nr:sporulation protein YjcZ [Paenibacillus thermoaerophilus]